MEARFLMQQEPTDKAADGEVLQSEDFRVVVQPEVIAAEVAV
jgi:hypothetical protein